MSGHRYRWLSEEHGGPLVALVHGMEASWRGWERLAGRLSTDYQVAALEMPWHTGTSYRWTRTGTPGTWVADALLALPRRPDLVIGHSFGASALLEALADSAADGRALADAAVLLAPFYCAPDCPVSWEMFDETRRAFDQLITDSVHGWLVRQRAAADPAVLDSMARKLVDRMGPLAFTEWFRQFVATAGLSLDAVSTPTLVVTGPHDPGLAGGRADALAWAMPLATVVCEDGYDHFGHISRPDRLAEMVTAFATEVLGRVDPLDAKETVR